VILFVLHRMHPNLHQVEKALIDSGRECVFVVSEIGPSEPADKPERIRMNPKTSTHAEIQEFMEKLKPEVLIQRNFSHQFTSFWQIARASQIPRFRYSQDPQQIPFRDLFVRPLRVVRLSRDIIRFRLILGPHKVVTPVMYWGLPGSHDFKNVCYLPFPAPQADLVEKRSTEVLTVLCVAKHGQRRKRVHWLLKALSRSDTVFRLQFVGARPGETEFFRQKWHRFILRSARELGERANLVSFHYDLTQEETSTLYGSADLFVLPSNREMMAISPLEAMSHGLPVLVASDGGAVGYVRPVGEEQIFKARSFRSFRSSLSRLLAEEGLRLRLAEAASLSITTTHSPQSFLVKVERALRSDVAVEEH